jgi:hypothetical protein
MINSDVEACPPLEGYFWQKSSDSVKYENIDVSNPKYYPKSSDSSKPVLNFPKTSFDDRAYYRLRVWNKLGECYSNIAYLNVTGGMYLCI